MYTIVIVGLLVAGGLFVAFPEGLAWLLLLSVFFYPFPINLPGLVLYPFECISCLLLAAAACRTVAKPRVDRMNFDAVAVCLLALSAVCMVSLTYSNDARNGFRAIRGLCFDPLIVYVGLTSCRASLKPRRLHILFLAMGVLVAGIALYQFFHPDLQFLSAYMEETEGSRSALPGGAVRVSAVFSNADILGEVLILVFLPLIDIVTMKRGIVGAAILGAALTVLAAIGASFTRAAWLGVIAGLAYYVYNARGRKGLSLLVATTAAAAMAVYLVPTRLLALRFQNDSSVSIRIEIVKTLWREVFFQRPLLGEGMGAMQVSFPKLVNGIPLYHAHNILMHIQAEVGIIGSVFAFLLLSRIRRLLSVGMRRPSSPAYAITPGAAAGCVGYFVASMFDAGSFLYIRASLLFWILISLIVIEGTISGMSSTRRRSVAVQSFPRKWHDVAHKG